VVVDGEVVVVGGAVVVGEGAVVVGAAVVVVDVVDAAIGSSPPLHAAARSAKAIIEVPTRPGLILTAPECIGGTGVCVRPPVDF
jgi:hypothetical protein